MSCDTNSNKYNLTIWQGATFSLTLKVQDANGDAQILTGYSARMQLRSSYNSGSAAESLTTSNGEISISGANLTMTLAASRTANLYVDLNSTSKPPKTMYVYDLELIDPANVVSKLLYGDVVVYGEVTR